MDDCLNEAGTLEHKKKASIAAGQNWRSPKNATPAAKGGSKALRNIGEHSAAPSFMPVIHLSEDLPPPGREFYVLVG